MLLFERRWRAFSELSASRAAIRSEVDVLRLTVNDRGLIAEIH